MFQRVRTVVQPNDKRSGNPPHNVTQGALVSMSGEQHLGEFDQELRAAEVALASLIMRHNIWETQVADETVMSLGSLRQLSWLLHHLLFVLFKGISRGLPVCSGHVTHRTGGDRGFCFETGFLSWVRIKLGRVIRGQRV